MRDLRTKRKPKNSTSSGWSTQICGFFVVLSGLFAVAIVSRIHVSSLDLNGMGGKQRNLQQDCAPGSSSSSAIATGDKFFNTRPRVMVAGPCAGSTATMDFIWKIMEAHGIKPYPMEYESLKPEKNWAWGTAYFNLESQNKSTDYEDVIIESLREMNRIANDKNQALIFKGDFSSVYKNYKLLFGLKNMGAVFSVLYRGNPIDTCICGIRDCFDQFSTHGYPVFASNGSKADLCFKRRSTEKVKTKTVLTEASKCGALMLGEQKVIRGFFEPIVEPAKSASYEDLFEFEYTSDPEALVRSLAAWKTFMAAFLDSVIDIKKIEAVLRSYQNSRPSPAQHSESVDGFQDVLKQIEDHDKYATEMGNTDQLLHGFLRYDTNATTTTKKFKNSKK